ERSGRPDGLGEYLDDPLLLFVPVRLLLGIVTAAATALLARGLGVEGPRPAAVILLGIITFVVVCELLLPLVIVGRDPERILGLLLPSFAPVAKILAPLTRWIARSVPSAKRPAAPTSPEEQEEETAEVAKAYIDTAEQEGLIEGEERRLLQSIVDF